MPATMIGESGPFQKTNRSAYLNFLRSKYEMYTGETRVQSRPYYLTLEPSDVCQLRCPTCVTGVENEMRKQKDADAVIYRSKRTMLSHDFFDALLDEIGEYLFLIVFYNFGEPLLNKDLPGLIRKAKALNIETDVNTNLSLPVSDERIEDLLTSGLDYLYCSIDGFSQETYQVHRVGGDFGLVKKNLERIVKTRDRLALKTCITYNFLVFGFNEHEAIEAERYCSDLGINFNTRDAFIHNRDWLPSYRKAEAPRVVPEAVALPPGFGHKEDTTNLAWSPLPDIDDSHAPPRCEWHYGYSAMTAGGAVTPCCAVPKQEDDFGTVVPGQTTFGDIWNGDRISTARAAFAGSEPAGITPVDTVCTRCPVPRFVHHLYSLHDFKVIGQFNNTFKGADPVLEQAFDLVSRARYGVGRDELFPEGEFHAPAQIFGTESAGRDDMARFLQFFETHFIAPARG